MLRRSVLAACLLAIATAAAAQPPKPAPAPTPPVSTPGPQALPPPPPPQAPGAIEVARRTRGKDLNIQVEITILDQSGSSAADKKVVTLLAADQTTGRVRANATARQENLGMVGTELNVDARPMVIDNDRVLLELTLEYSPLRPSPVQQQPTNLNEQLSVILQNGRPLTISQAADPVSDRRMTVEVRATILK